MNVMSQQILFLVYRILALQLFLRNIKNKYGKYFMFAIRIIQKYTT